MGLLPRTGIGGDAWCIRYLWRQENTRLCNCLCRYGGAWGWKYYCIQIDRLQSGPYQFRKILFRIYEQTKDEKYKKALDLLYSQFAGQPRNEDGGFWHKKIYPHQMWLDGLYMGAPFYAEYAFRNNRPQDYADVINQFITCARHTYDPKNGLYRPCVWCKSHGALGRSGDRTVKTLLGTCIRTGMRWRW